MINRFFDNTKLDLKSNKGHTKAMFDLIDGKFYLTILGVNGTSIRREIGIGSVIDMAKLVCDAVDFKCKKCKKKMSIEKGECHHGCLSCYK